MTAPADGKSELCYHRSLIMRSRKNEQFVFLAITQIAGVGGEGRERWGGGIAALRSHMDFQYVWMCFNDLIIWCDCARLHLLFGGSGSSRHIATAFPSYMAAVFLYTPLRACVHACVCACVCM